MRGGRPPPAPPPTRSEPAARRPNRHLKWPRGRAESRPQCPLKISLLPAARGPPLMLAATCPLLPAPGQGARPRRPTHRARSDVPRRPPRPLIACGGCLGLLGVRCGPADAVRGVGRPVGIYETREANRMTNRTERPTAGGFDQAGGGLPASCVLRPQSGAIRGPMSTPSPAVDIKERGDMPEPRGE